MNTSFFSISRARTVSTFGLTGRSMLGVLQERKVSLWTLVFVGIFWFVCVVPQVAEAGSVNVQDGTVTFSTLTTDVAITAVELEHAFVRYSANSTESEPDDYFVTVELIDADTLRITRNNTGSITVNWQVIEDSAATVQRGTTTVASGNLTATQSITAIDQSNTFLMMNSRTNEPLSAEFNRAMYAGYFSADDEITFERLESGATSVIAWEVVTIADATVQSGTTSLPVSTASDSTTITPVATTSAFVVAHDAATVAGMAYRAVISELSSSSTVQQRRSNSASGQIFTSWYVVEVPRYRVQAVGTSYATAQTVNVTIDYVNENRTWTLGTVRNNGTGTTNLNNHFTLALTSATNWQVYKQTSSNSTEVVGYVISIEPRVGESIDWVPRTAAGNNDGWNDIAYGNGTFVAVGYSGDRVMTSPDGITWTARSPLSNNDGWLGVTYGAGLFVAVGSGGDYIMTSADNGATWAVRTHPQANAWREVTYAEDLGLFVAVAQSGTDRVMTSPDGITWTARSTPGDSDFWKTVTYGNGTFVAMACGKSASVTCNTTAGDGNRVMTSPDGTNWTLRSTGLGADRWNSITFGNGLFVAIGEDDDRIATSPDGITWTSRSSSLYIPTTFAVTYGAGRFVSVGYCEDGLYTCLAQSTDGVTWTAVPTPTPNEDGGWTAVTYGEDTFVAVNYGFGTTSGSVMTASSTNDLTQSGFRFLNDDGGEADATFAMTANNDITWGVNTPLRLRMQIDSATAVSTEDPFYLQYKRATETDWLTVGLNEPAPTIVATSSGVSGTSDVTSHPIMSLPSGEAGDLLLVIFSRDGQGASETTSNGWVKLHETAQTIDSGTIDVSGALFYKFASAAATSSDALTITTDSAQQSSYIVYRLRGAGTPYARVATGNSTNSDSPAADLFARDYLWIATRSGDGTTVASAAPTNFYQMISSVASGSNGASTNAAISYQSVANLNPGTFTSATEQWVSYTIAVPPRSTANPDTLALQTRQPTAAANNTSYGSIAWTNATNALVSDNTYAVATANNTTATNYLYLSDFDFAIPDSAEIIGIEVFIERDREGTSSGNLDDSSVRLFKAGTAVGSNLTGGLVWRVNELVSVHGSYSELWGTTWTVDDINNSTFGIGLSFAGSAAGTAFQGRVDNVRVNVYYKVPPDIVVSGSTYISAGGEPTTARLSVPGGKTTVDFATGRIQDDANPSAEVYVPSNDYTELEWSLIATGTATTGDIYDVRVSLGPEVELSSYSTDARLTMGTYVPPATSQTVSLSGTVYEDDGSTVLTATRTVMAVVHDDTATVFSTTTDDGTWTLDVTTTLSDATNWTPYDAFNNNDEWEDITYGEGTFVAVGDCVTSVQCVMTSPDGITWTAQTPAQANDWIGVTYGEGLFVAVAQSGTQRIMTSPDGITWTGRSVLQQGWRDITYGNGTFVVTGQSGRYMYSSNGTSWTNDITAEANDWFSVTYGEGLFVAVSYNGTNRVITSPDGITWTPRTAAATKFWRAVTYGNGRFVASASDSSDSFMYSDDGITWYSGTDSADAGFYRVTYGNGTFVATGIFKDVIVTSPDGMTWTVPPVASNTTAYMAITYGDGKFVALADSGPTATTSDLVLVSESLASPHVPVTLYLGGVDDERAATVLQVNRATTLTEDISLVEGQVRVAERSFTAPAVDLNTFEVFDESDSSEVLFVASTSLDTLTIDDDIALVIEAGATVRTPRTLELGGNLENNGTLLSDPNDTLLASGEVSALTGALTGTSTLGRVVASSTIFRNNAVTWTSASAAQANEWRGVAYGNGRFVAVSLTGTNRVMTSPDGITWTPQSAAGNDDRWTDVIFANGQFVAVAETTSTDYVMTSPDGLTWTPQTAPAQSWHSLAYGNGLYVASGISGTGNRIMTSPDGITWTNRSTPSNQYYNVTYGNGRFVAVADVTNGALVSYDGVTWNSYPIAGSEDDWQALGYGNGLFVVVGDCTIADCIATSPDGITWSVRTSPASVLWDAVTYSNGLYVAIARTSTSIMTSPDGITWTARTNHAANSWADIIYGDGKFLAVARTGTNRVAVSTTGTTTAGVLTFATTTALTDLTIATGTVVTANSLTIAGSYENRGTAYLSGTTTFTTSAGAFVISSSTVLRDDAVLLDITNSDDSPKDMFWHPDGTQVYVAGDTTDSVYMYHLTTPWDITTGSLDTTALYVGAIGSTIDAITWSADGTQLFVVEGGTTDSIYEFTVRTPWELGSAVLTDRSLDIGAYETSPHAVQFTPDGYRLYVIGSGTDNIDQYTLSAPWDITTAIRTGFSVSFDDLGQTIPRSFLFNPDGQILHTMGNNFMLSSLLTTPWDVTTATSTGSTYSVREFSTFAQKITFSGDGRFLYLLDNTGTAEIYAFPLRSADQSLRGTLTGDSALTRLEHSGEHTLTFTEPLEVANLSLTNASSTMRGADGVPIMVREAVTNTGTLEAPTSPVTFSSSTGFYVTGGIALGSPFSVSGQDGAPFGLHVSADGTRVFMVGQDNDRVYSYTLATPWDMSTASYDSRFIAIGSQESNPRDVVLSPDGTRMLVLGSSGNDVTSYTLRVPFDLTTALYDNYEFSHASEDLSMYGMSMKPDGTMLYLVGSASDYIFTYRLSTPWDVRTATTTGDDFSIITQVSFPRGLDITPDGLHAYVTGDGNVYHYIFGTPWDITSLQYEDTISVSGADSTPRNIVVSPRGDRLYLLGDAGNDITTFSLPEQSINLTTTGSGVIRFGNTTIASATTTTFSGAVTTLDLTIATSAILAGPGTLTIGGQYVNNGTTDYTGGTQIFTPLFGSHTMNDATLTLVDELDFDTAGFVETQSGQKFQFSTDGTILYHLVNNGNYIRQYTLTTPWYPSTAIEQPVTLSTLGVDSDAQDFIFRPDGRRLYMIGQGNDRLAQFTVAEPWNIATAQLQGTTSISASTLASQAIVFRPDGTYLYILDSGATDTVDEYVLSEPWNALTASSTGVSLSVDTQDTNARGIRFSTDGRHLYMKGITNDDLYRYDLSTPWDLTTATVASGVHETTAYDTTVQGIVLLPDQTAYFSHGNAAAGNTLARYDVVRDTQVATGTITGTSAFNNLTIENSSAGTATSGVAFAAPVETIGTFTLESNSYTTLLANATNTFSAIDWNGDDESTRAQLESSEAGASTTVVAANYVSVGNLSVRDINNAGTDPIYCIDNCIDNGNNTNWLFTILPATLHQSGFQFISDTAGESTAPFLMSQNTDITWATSTPLRFRAQIDNQDALAVNGFALQYKPSGNTAWHTLGVDDSSPVIVATSSGRSTGDTTSHPITLPSGDPGDLLLVIMSLDATTERRNVPEGWKSLETDQRSSSHMSEIFYSFATTSNPSLTVTLETDAEEASYIVYRIAGAGQPIADDVYDSDTTLDPPLLTADATRSYLLIAARSGDGTTLSTGRSSGYSDLIQIQANTSAGATTEAVHRYAIVGSEDPSSFTSTAVNAYGWTIMIPPAYTPSVDQLQLATAMSPGTVVNDTSYGSRAWTNPSNAIGSDDAYAYFTANGTTDSNYLKLTNFGFDIPSEATITGVTAWFDRSWGGGSTEQIRDDSVKLVKGGVVSGTDQVVSYYWIAQDNEYVYGSPTNLWGTTLTPADVNASNFGVVLSSRGTGTGANHQGRIDNVRLYVYYTMPAPIALASSTYIGNGGESTTARLTPPEGKFFFDFTPGRIQDDENPADSITFPVDTFTEYEWVVVATGTASTDDVYDMRVVISPGNEELTYDHEAQITIGSYQIDGEPWNENDWTEREVLVIDPANIDATLTNFPVYVDLADLSAGFWTGVASDCGDIRVTNASGVEVPREVVACDTGTDSGELHFRADTISATAQTSFFVYYNGSANDYLATQTYGTHNVWSNGYYLVYHLEEGDSTASNFYRDSTDSGLHGTLTDADGDSVTVSTGRVGSAFNFNGDADSINIADFYVTTAGTISTWIKRDVIAEDRFIGLNDQYELRSGLTALAQSASAAYFDGYFSGVSGPGTSATLNNTNRWYYLTGTYNESANVSSIFLDGLFASSSAHNTSSPGTETTLALGRRLGDASTIFDGSLDEVRVSSVIRSDAWIKAEYYNQATTTDFYSLGETATATIATHSVGRISNTFSFQNKTDEPVYSFRITPSTAITVDQLMVAVTGMKGIESGELADFRVYRDVNVDNDLDGGDVQVGGAGTFTHSGQKGTVTFSTDFTLSVGTNFIMTADLTSVDANDVVVFDLRSSGLIATDDAFDLPVLVSGSVPTIQQTRSTKGSGGGGGSVPGSVGGEAPEGDGDVGGGEDDGGGEAGQVPDGDNIIANPNFFRPTGQSGSWTDGVNALTSDGVRATSPGSVSHVFSNFGLTIPSGNTIVGIEVKLDSRFSSGGGTISVDLSGNSGTNYTTIKATPSLTATDVVYTLGAPADTWNKTWSPSEFSDGTFRVRITSSAANLQLDGIEVRVYHQATGGGGGGGDAI